jgi:predicted nucleotidyltransferase
VSTLGLFGSYVRGERRRGSDLDVLVEFDRIPTLLEFVDLQY